MQFLALWILAASVVGTSSGLGSLSQCADSSEAPFTSDIEGFANTVFDYIIIGGGTAGLTVAARLAEDPSVKIGVIEAGIFHYDDPLIDIPGYMGNAIGNSSYDWNFVTIPQPGTGSRNMSLPRGKMLGGSSGLNFMAFNRASAPEYDAWSLFAPESDWDWDGLVPYFMKSEQIAQAPRDPFPQYSDETEPPSPFILDGLSGPLAVSFNAIYMDSVAQFVQSMNALGIDTNPIPQAGNATGVYNSPVSVNRTAGTRSYSPTGYICNQPLRSNLQILLGAQATKILFSGSRSQTGIVAQGVEFSVASKTYSVNASREVVLSAGTIQTPQILELSGIGNPYILAENGINTLVNLPGVGENFQEHLYVGVEWQLIPGQVSFDILRNNLTVAAEQLAQYNANGTGLYAALDSTLTFMPLHDFADAERRAALLQIFDEEAEEAPIFSLESLQYPIQRAWLEKDIVAQSELVVWSRGVISPAPNESYVSILGGISHPMSRGSVHISSSDPLAAPTINPQFLSKNFDSQFLLDALKFVQSIGRQSPLADVIAVQTAPDPSVQDDADLLEFVRTTTSDGDHLIGTAAMAPREFNGVVDPSLKVYGTANLRVVDASVIPLLFAAHTQATVYAIAEKAATMILGA